MVAFAVTGIFLWDEDYFSGILSYAPRKSARPLLNLVTR